MEFKNSKWKSTDSIQVNLKITHFNEQMKRKSINSGANKNISWGRACGTALKYIENLYSEDESA